MSVQKLNSESLLALYLRNLQLHPLRTKSLTSASLNAIMEVSASYIAGEKNAQGGYVTERVPQMALYGLLISGPLQHVLVSFLQKAFAGKTSAKDKLLQILASNLLVGKLYMNYAHARLHLFRMLYI